MDRVALSENAVRKWDKILIVCGGLFGLTFAFELRKRGYDHVTVLDRNLPPAPDRSSVDTSRLLQANYADPFYSNMAFEAMEQWEADWRKYFHRSGLAMVARSSSHSCIDGCKRTLDGFGETVEPFHGSEDERQIYPTFNDDPVCGYRNKDAGWVDSGFMMKDLVYQCVCSGVSFVTGPMGTVSSLVLSNGYAHGRWE